MRAGGGSISCRQQKRELALPPGGLESGSGRFFVKRHAPRRRHHL
ncbi:hypothetical protein ASZ90_009822 [hydrocarbon metagenome]|uniref:Uncharacterized protein n=1 Tax=hydrocarbon metagenome TaxID=938273 RepID=A0A0W8FHS8_9ZZZZ